MGIRFVVSGALDTEFNQRIMKHRLGLERMCTIENDKALLPDEGVAM